MMTRSAATRSESDDIPSRVSSLENVIQSMAEQIAKLVRLQEESVKRFNGQEETSENGERRQKSNDRSGENHSFFAIKGRRLELPSFNGTDPDGWILRADRYCNLNRLNEEEKLEVAVIALEGDALKWFQWENKRRPIVTWEEFKKLLLIQFRSVGEGSLCEQFLALKQETTVKDYKMKFVELAAPLDGITEEVYIKSIHKRSFNGS